MADFGIETAGRKPYFGFRVAFCALSVQAKAHDGFLLADIRIDLDVFGIEQGGRLQLDVPHDSIPIPLCLVGHAVGVGSHAHTLNPVVHPDCQYVCAAAGQAGQVKNVRGGKAVCTTSRFPVQKYLCFNVRAFEKERDALSRPFHRDIDVFAIPCRAYVMAVGGEEKGQFEVVRLAVFLHVRVVEIGAVINGTCPAGFYCGIVAFQTLGHAARQQDAVGQRLAGLSFGSGFPRAVDLEFPVSSQVQGVVLRREAVSG